MDSVTPSVRSRYTPAELMRLTERCVSSDDSEEAAAVVDSLVTTVTDEEDTSESLDDAIRTIAAAHPSVLETALPTLNEYVRTAIRLLDSRYSVRSARLGLDLARTDPSTVPLITDLLDVVFDSLLYEFKISSGMSKRCHYELK